MEERLKKLKKIIIILFIIVIILGIVFYILNNMQKENDIFAPNTDEEEINYSPEEVTNKVSYFAVKKAITNYGNEIANKRASKLMDILDKNYISEKEITQENVLDNAENIKISDQLSNYFSITPYIDKMYQKQEEGTYLIGFLATGHFNYDTDQKRDDFSIIVNVDMQNGTYSIIPTKKVSIDYSDINNFEKYKINQQEIEKNDNNGFSLSTVSDTDIIREHIISYQELIKTDIEKAYNKLDQEYKEKKFPTLEEFEKYINENKSSLLTYSVKEYDIENKDDKTRYTCNDNKDCYLIFEEKVLLDYSIKLDPYTVKTKADIDEYNSLSEKHKIQSHVAEWMIMVNNKDYKAIYNLLDETFRNTYFETLEKFENYMAENYPQYYDVQISDDIKKESNAYVAQTTITSRINPTPLEKIFPKSNSYIIIQPQGDGKFIMSFYVRRH